MIPEDWEVSNLREVSISISDGTHYTPKYVEEGIPFYSVENVTTDDFKNTKFISKNEHNKLIKRCNPEKGDILLTRIGTLGQTKLIDWDINASIYVSLALIKTNEKIDNNYLYTYTKFDGFVNNLIKRSLTNAIPQKINMENIGDIPIPLPPLQEQKAIAKVLSDVDELITSIEELIDKKQKIKQGTMQLLLTGKKRLPGFTGEWEVKKLGEIADITMGQSPSSEHYNFEFTGVPLIQGNADIMKRKTIKRMFTTQITKTCNAGDVIMTVRAPVGKVGKALFDACIGRGVCAISYTNDYLYYYLISIEKCWTKLSKGSTFDSINSSDIKELEIYIPKSIEEQKAIAQILSDMDLEIEALEEKLEKYKLIKDGMMEQLLTGKVRLI